MLQNVQNFINILHGYHICPLEMLKSVVMETKQKQQSADT